MRSVVSLLLPSSRFTIQCRAPAYSASDMNSDRVSDANGPNENTPTNSNSSEVATVVLAASSENSRMKFCDVATKGASNNTEPRNTNQTSEAMSAMLCCSPGRRWAATSAALSSAHDATVMMAKRCTTMANGCGSIWYDQLSRPMANRPRPITPPCVHHHASGSRPAPNKP